MNRLGNQPINRLTNKKKSFPFHEYYIKLARSLYFTICETTCFVLYNQKKTKKKKNIFHNSKRKDEKKNEIKIIFLV